VWPDDASGEVEDRVLQGQQPHGTYPNVQFTFLGFTFRPREALNNQHNRRFTSFLPAVSNDALKRMRQEVREWRIHRRTSVTLEILRKQCNLTIQGWWNYYGAFYQRAMRGLFRYIDSKLLRWARRKYKTLRGTSGAAHSGYAR
jgi:RNA-directed DNA polymerase